MTLILFSWIQESADQGKCKWSRVPRIYTICASIERTHMHTRARANRHIPRLRVRTQ